MRPGSVISSACGAADPARPAISRHGARVVAARSARTCCDPNSTSGWRAHGGELLEIGPGTGSFAAESLEIFALLGTPLERYALLDTSADMRARQRERSRSIAGSARHRLHVAGTVGANPSPAWCSATSAPDATPCERFSTRDGVPWRLGASGSRAVSTRAARVRRPTAHAQGMTRSSAIRNLHSPTFLCPTAIAVNSIRVSTPGSRRWARRCAVARYCSPITVYRAGSCSTPSAPWQVCVAIIDTVRTTILFFGRARRRHRMGRLHRRRRECDAGGVRGRGLHDADGVFVG
jgi:hypothetical protein